MGSKTRLPKPHVCKLVKYYEEMAGGQLHFGMFFRVPP